MGQQVMVVEEGEQCLTGCLENWMLSDLLQWLAATKKTAMVRVGEGWGAGVVFVGNGRVFRCEWGVQGGEEALRSLLALRLGHFAVMQRVPSSVRPNIFRPFEQILLECAIEQDHAAQAMVA